MNPQENIPVHIRRRIHLIDKVIDNLLPNMYPCDYNSSDHFVEGVLDEIFYFLREEPNFYGVNLISINDFILDHKYDELTDYFNEHCIVLKNDNLQESIRRIFREDLDKKQKVFYTFSELKNHWVDDNDRSYHDEFFDNKDYEDFHFDNFYDMDEMFGHENSLFGTRGLPVGHPDRSSKSFDYYNKKFGPMIVRVIKNNDLQESIRRILREENKKSSLLRAIEEDGLYQVMQDTGLSMGQIILKYDNLPREVLERYIKDFINEEGYHQTDGSVQLGYEVEIQTHVYIDHFYMKGDKVTLEIKRFDYRGHQSEGYIESMLNLTDEEIFNIVDDMTSWSDQNDL